MTDSDMDIDDDEVEEVHEELGKEDEEATDKKVREEHTIAVESELLDKPIKTSDSQYGNSNNKLEDEKAETSSRFPAPVEGNEPEQKHAAVLCKFFAKGWCKKGNSCRFLHAKENSNRTSQQQAENNKAGRSDIQSGEERRTSDIKNGETFLHTRADIFFANPSGSQRVFPSMNEMCFMSSAENMGREHLKQSCGIDVIENRFLNNNNSFTLRSSFVHEHRSSIPSGRKTNMESSGSALTGSLLSTIPTNECASIYRSGSLPTVQGISVSSDQDAEGNITSNSRKVPSNAWESSEPFKASFTIPPYILPSSDALYNYDPFMDIENPQDRSVSTPLSSKEEHSRKNSRQQKDDDSASVPQALECNNDDQNSSCSQNHHLKAHGVVEGVATSVVEQNDIKMTPPSKEISLSAAAENKVLSKRNKPATGRHDSSYEKKLKSDDEVRSDVGMKVMRQFRTAVVETIKEMLKPLWREGGLSKDVHNMIVKRASEKIVSNAVQSQQVPTDTESVQQYLSLSATKIVKLVEWYIEKHRKP